MSKQHSNDAYRNIAQRHAEYMKGECMCKARIHGERKGEEHNPGKFTKKHQKMSENILVLNVRLQHPAVGYTVHKRRTLP